MREVEERSRRRNVEEGRSGGPERNSQTRYKGRKGIESAF